MKNCIECGAAAGDEAEACPACHRPFSYVGSADRAPAPPSGPVTMRKRPDGSWLIALGWGGLALGLLFFILAMAKTTAGFTDDLQDITIGDALLVGAGAFCQLGLLFLLTGLVVRAIWFLPGRDRKAPDGAEPPPSG